MTEFLRMSGIYWGVTALDLMDNVEKLDKASIIDFIKKCQCPVSGGISPCEGHDPHILYTLSAIQVGIQTFRIWRFELDLQQKFNLRDCFQIQILCIYDCVHEIDLEAVAKYVSGLQQPDGSFFGDKWGEVDTRFSFCAVAILTLIVCLPFSNYV